MTIRILNPRDWEKLETGFAIPMNGDKARTVKVEFNTSGPAAIHMSHDAAPDDDGAVAERSTFLGMVNGLEKIEVVADPGSLIVATSEYEVWYCTNEGQFNGIPTPEDKFTELIGERTRAEVLEEMIALTTHNYNLLRQSQAQERADAAAVAQRLAAAEAALGEAQREQTAAPKPEPVEGETQSPAAEPPAVSS